jgi:TetR/AcrR family transcriptional repressor of mexJK operon
MKKKASGKPARGKREAVVEAAAKLFLHEGFGTTSMDAIAQEAGVSKATVYSYFKSKESLFAEIMEDLCRKIGGNGPEALSGASPEAALRAIATYGLSRMLRSIETPILQRVVAESRQFPSLGQTFWETGPGKLKELVAAYLREQHRRQTLRVPDPDGAATLLIGLVTGPYVLPLLLGVGELPSEEETRPEIERIVSAFLHTLRRETRGETPRK